MGIQSGGFSLQDGHGQPEVFVKVVLCVFMSVIHTHSMFSGLHLPFNSQNRKSAATKDL